MRATLRWTLLAAFCYVGLAAAQTPGARFEEDFDDDAKPWQELQTQLPAPPQAADLIRIDVSASTTYKFGLDRKSISIGADGVTRYTLVVVSDEGARNISYEGIRCATGEKKLYAFGRTDGSWSRSRRNHWDVITEATANRQHAVLAREVFCDGQQQIEKMDLILSRLSSRPPLFR